MLCTPITSRILASMRIYSQFLCFHYSIRKILFLQKQMIICAEKAVIDRTETEGVPTVNLVQKASPNWKLLAPSSSSIRPAGRFNYCNWILQRCPHLNGRISWLEITREMHHTNYIGPRIDQSGNWPSILPEGKPMHPLPYAGNYSVIDKLAENYVLH